MSPASHIRSAIIIILQIFNVQSYWISQNRFTWSRASWYCQTICNSNLASFHSESDYLEARHLVNNSLSHSLNSHSIWIGLHDISSEGNFEWSDGSSFDYGTDISGGKYPWASSGEPNNVGEEDCVALFVRTDQHHLRWNDESCTSSLNRFMCNSCENVLDKYHVIDVRLAWSDWNTANQDCQLSYNTTLASIHNENDLEYVQHLCNATGPPNNRCWLGLKRINSDSDIFIWSDNTEWDFGNDISGGIWPWANYYNPPEPNNYNNEEECVEIREENYGNGKEFVWNDDKCSNQREAYICNKPSEICYFGKDRNQWMSIIEPGIYAEYIRSTVNDYCAITSDDNNFALMKDRKWSIINIPIRIEYIFSISQVLTVSNNIGITVHFDQICNYSYYGVSIINGEIYYQGQSYGYNVIFGRYYAMELMITLGINGWIDTDLYFDYNHLGTKSVNVNDFNYLYFGLRNINMSMEGKSLYISGTPQYDNSYQLQSQTICPSSVCNLFWSKFYRAQYQFRLLYMAKLHLIFLYKMLYVNHNQILSILPRHNCHQMVPQNLQQILEHPNQVQLIL